MGKIEEVARALCLDAGGYPDRTYDMHYPDDPDAIYEWAGFRGAARAAIEAMRVPTEAMVDAGWQARESRNNIGENTILTYTAMIDAALGEVA